MTNFKVFSIPKHLIPKTFPAPISWEKYDENCIRGDLKFNDNVIDSILSLSKTKIKRTKKEYTVHHVKYSLNNKPYMIDEHQDWCKFTIIVYLDKSDEVTDEFWVENEKVKDDLWESSDSTYKCLIFWGNVPHHGKVFGKGKRDILCIFSD